jgi:hypothetical protein
MARSKRDHASESEVEVSPLESLDMPQPIPHNRKISFSFGRKDVMQRPKLTPYIASILMHWNEIESRLSIFLAALLGGEAQTVIKVFLALQTDGGRKATMDTVAELKLSPDDLKRFQEIQRDIGGRYSERNKAVHGAWGISPEYPDDLLWYDPRESVQLFPNLMATVGDDKRAERRALIAEMNKSLRIYTEKDFTDILMRFETTYSALEKFTEPYIKPLFERMHT